MPTNKIAWPVTMTTVIVGLMMAEGPVWADQAVRDVLASTLRPGDRVRVTAPRADAPWLTGRTLGQFVHADDSLIAIHVPNPCEDTVHSFATASLKRVERSEGPRPRAMRGLLIGAAAGISLGLLLALRVPDSSDGGREMAAVFFPALGVGPCAILGAMIGSTVRVEKWRTLPLDAKVGLGGAGPPVEVVVVTRWSF